MKNKFLSILFGFCLCCALPAVSANIDTEQSQYLTDTKATIAVQKQPNYDHNQKQKVKNNWFCVVVQVNGKLKDSNTSNPDD